ncbi:kielin/chordin-like protein [Plakobranchus ocellatus]|uniref:Kielin/chordin-like protein n=1 Tax=Plakobranchus ocellatus TaxID=259542 RepID=A0AAV3YV13_9GAST|nr:kielin/chordin-like protein [Plakobranchus ocellatus]
MGRVDCEKEQCVVTCTHPRQDLCCPKCDSCSFEGALYENGASFQPGDCRSCTCRNGNVICEQQSCPSTLCPSPKKVVGQCCEVCQGCTFRGILYDEGVSWVTPDSPCTVCTCNGGLVTCMAKDCFAPCSDPVTPPGQCCPECPTCNYNGIQYSEGQEFSPNGDPCDICVCQNGRLRCEHNNCPGVANCPGDSIRQPEPGTCCSTCLQQFSTGCSVADLGKITRPRAEDPCFYCECKEDFMWVCMKEECPVLTCPPDVQTYRAGQCCPECPPCFDVSDASYHHEGSQWSAVEDPCIVCTCNNGQVLCEMQECEPISCEDYEEAIVPEGQCCQICQAMPDASCFYQGNNFQPGEEWSADECTICRCGGGQVTCNVRQCSRLQCKRDEAPMTTPGQCCPVCKKEPGTCLVFGDPHYRTFDGVTLHFQGTCRYIMAKDCQGDQFSVEVQHDSRGVRGEVAWAQNLTVMVAGAKIDLLQDLAVQVNGQSVTLPYLYEPHILVEMTGKSVLLTTRLGLRVLWDGSHYGEISVPGADVTDS